MEIKSLIIRNTGFVFGILVATFFGAGCTSTKIAIDVLRPPNMELSAPISRVAVVNRVDNIRATTKHYIDGVIIGQYNGWTDILVNEAVVNLVNTFNANLYLTAFDTMITYIPKNGKINGPILQKVYSDKVCERMDIDAFIAIEGFDAEVSTDNQVNYSSPVDRNYGTVRIPYFDGEQSVYMKMFFRTYLCRDSSSIADNEASLATQASVSASGRTPAEVDANLADASNVLVQAARELGADYAKEIGPYWEEQNRTIYIKGAEQMEEAYALVKIGNWAQATDIWYMLATSNNEKIAMRATYNLILASEVAGDLELAKEWANLCVSKYQMKEGEWYLATLRLRESEISKIKMLFPSMW